MDSKYQCLQREIIEFEAPNKNRKGYEKRNGGVGGKL